MLVLHRLGTYLDKFSCIIYHDLLLHCGGPCECLCSYEEGYTTTFFHFAVLSLHHLLLPLRHPFSIAGISRPPSPRLPLRIITSNATVKPEDLMICSEREDRPGSILQVQAASINYEVQSHWAAALPLAVKLHSQINILMAVDQATEALRGYRRTFTILDRPRMKTREISKFPRFSMTILCCDTWGTVRFTRDGIRQCPTKVCGVYRFISLSKLFISLPQFGVNTDVRAWECDFKAIHMVGNEFRWPLNRSSCPSTAYHPENVQKLSRIYILKPSASQVC